VFKVLSLTYRVNQKKAVIPFLFSTFVRCIYFYLSSCIAIQHSDFLQQDLSLHSDAAHSHEIFASRSRTRARFANLLVSISLKGFLFFDRHRQNRETRKVGISWFLSTFPELAVNLMCQLTVEISWLCRGIEYRCDIESKQRTRAMIVLVERYCKTCMSLSLSTSRNGIYMYTRETFPNSSIIGSDLGLFPLTNYLVGMVRAASRQPSQLLADY